MIATEAIGRVLEVAEAKVVEADTELHEQRCEAERRRRYVGLGRTDEHGLRTLIARLEAGDAAAVDAVVHRVAEIIAPRHPEAHPEELRALAFGWLARPAELFTLLLAPTDADFGPAPGQQPALDLELTDPEQDSEPAAPSRALAFPADLLDALRDIDLRPLAPRAVLHVHLHEAALHSGDGVARVEGFGPLTLTRLAELLRTHQVKVQPVQDLSDRVRYTAYEHPESLRDQVHLITGGDYWPYATSTSRNVDLDHPTPFDHGDEGRASPARPDRPPQLRPPRPTTPPLEDPRRLPVTPVRGRPLRLAHPPRTRVPRRPHRHPPHPPREGADHPRRARRRRHLPRLTDASAFSRLRPFAAEWVTFATARKWQTRTFQRSCSCDRRPCSDALTSSSLHDPHDVAQMSASDCRMPAMSIPAMLQVIAMAVLRSSLIQNSV